MEHILISVNAVGPLFLFMAIGWLAKRKNLLDDHVIRVMNRLIYRLFLPVLLLYNIINSDLTADFHWSLIGIAAISSLLSTMLSVGLAMITEKEAPRRASLAQGMFRNNYITFGIAIATSVYGAGAAAEISLLIAFIVPLNNIFAIIVLTAFRSERISYRLLLREVVMNPFVIAAFAGFVLLSLHVQLPAVVMKTTASISNVGIPLSMLLLGATFSFTETAQYKKSVIVGVLTKLILLPLLFIPIYILLGLRHVELLVLLIALSTPPAVSSHIMAGQLGADSTLASHLIVYASAASIITIFGWLLALQFIGVL